jgi:hypothetical protein
LKRICLLSLAILFGVSLFGCAASPKTPAPTEDVKTSYLQECPISITSLSFKEDNTFQAVFANQTEKTVQNIQYLSFCYNKAGSSLDEPGSFQLGTASGVLEPGKTLELMGSAKKEAAFAVVIVTKVVYQDNSAWENPYQNIQGTNNKLSSIYFCKKITAGDTLVLPK